MADASGTIGSGGDYTNLADFASSIDVTTHPCIGSMLDGHEENGGVSFSGNSTSASYYIHLTTEDGAEPQGVAHEVSANGNARIYTTINTHPVICQDNYFRLSWMEIKGPPGPTNRSCVFYTVTGSGTFYGYQNVIHGNHLYTGNEFHGFGVADSDAVLYVYRNIIYGFAGNGVNMGNAATGSLIYYNTIYECNYADLSYRGGIAPSGNVTTKYNASFDNEQRDIYQTYGTQDYNYTSYAAIAGSNSVGSLTSTDQFQNATTTWTSVNLLPKSGADLIGEGVDESATGLPDIDESIDDRGTSISGAWDIGAAQFAGTSGVGAAVYHHFKQMGVY